MDKNEKAALDAYRQERKERIAKQAKQADKKSNSHAGAKSVMGKIVKGIISVVVVVAILGGILNFFGVPQRLIPTVTIDGESYSMSELSLYYMQMYSNIRSYASSYESNYGEGYGKMLTGYDINLAPDAQTTKDDDGNEITWDEYFLEQAVKQMASVKRYYKAAVDAGIEMTDEATAQIEDSLAQMDTYRQSYSLSRFISLQFGKGVTTSLYKKVLTEQLMGSLYQESRQEELKAEYSADDVNGVYAEDKTKYDVVSFRWYTIDIKSKAEVTSSLAEDESSVVTTSTFEEEALAESFIEKVKSENNYNEETFKKVVLEFVEEGSQNYETYKQDNATLMQKIDKSTIESNVSEDAAKWLYETDENGNYIRQPGDMNYYVSDDEKSVYVFYATGTPYQDETVPASVRHILVQFPEAKKEPVSGEAVSGEVESEAATISDSVKAECESEAVSILNDYKTYIEENVSGQADEEYFGELASKLSDDTASQSTGGLIEDLANDGQYVPSFEDWVFAEGDYAGEERTPGTTGIVETEYGYHVMYYVGGHENPVWYETILNDLITEDWEAEQTEFEKQFGEDAIERKAMIEGWVKKSCLDMIETNYQ